MAYDNVEKNRLLEKAIHALLTAPTMAQAAEKTGVTEASLRLWLKDDAFKARFAEAKREMFISAMVVVHAKLAEGIKSMWALCLDETRPGTSRVSAFRVLTDLAWRAYDLEALEARIAKLEGGNRAA